MTSDLRRLLVVSQPPIAGVPRHILDLLEQLPAGWSVDVACPPDTDLWNGAARLPGVRRHPIAPDRAPSLRDVRTLALLLPLVWRADIVHAHSSKAGFLARFAAFVTFRRRRCVFTPHGWSFWAFGGKAGTFYVLLERVAARWCGRIIAVSRFEKDAGLGRRVGRSDQYVVIPNGIATERFSAAPRPQSGRLVMVARLDAPKLPVLAIEALACVHRTHPEAVLDLIGDGPLRVMATRRAEELGVAQAVRFLGQRDDVPVLLSTAAVAIHASSYEGSPLTVLEAMAAGVPVVATAAGGLDELVDDGRTGFVVPFDPGAIAQRVVELLDDPALARRLGDAGRASARRHYDRAHMAGATFAVYDEVMSEARD